VRFRLKWPSPRSSSARLAYNWIYKADILAKDSAGTRTNVMGTGPFKFVEHVKGSHWVGKKNPDYWGQGQALPGQLPGSVHQLVVGSGRPPSAASARTSSSAAFSPADRDAIVSALGNKDHGAGEPWGLRAARHDEPRSQAVGRQARAPRASRWLSTATRGRRTCLASRW
jgi:ABC-type transport system substrate-binding protein